MTASLPPRNEFDRDPEKAYRWAHKAIDQDVKNGYMSKLEERKLRNAANRLYLKAKKGKRYGNQSG
jgi:hypothetical protein